MLPDCELSGRHPYEYMIGGKNGYTDIARLTLVTFAKKDGHRLVCVVLKDEAKPNHYLDTIALFDYGFACYDDPAVRAQIDAKAEELKPEKEENLPDEKVPAGEGAETLTEEEMDARVDSLGKREDSGPEDMGEQEKRDRPDGKQNGNTILTVLVIFVVLAAAAVCGFIFWKSYQRERERKRRQAEIMARHRARKQQREG